MFLTVIVSLYVFSHAYNLLLFLWYDNPLYQINSHMGATNARYKSEDLQQVRCVNMSVYRIRKCDSHAYVKTWTQETRTQCLIHDYGTHGN